MSITVTEAHVINNKMTKLTWTYSKETTFGRRDTGSVSAET